MSLIATLLRLAPASDQYSGQGSLPGFIHRLFWFPPGKRSRDEVGIGSDGKQSSPTPGHLWVRRGRRHRGVTRHAPLGALGYWRGLLYRWLLGHVGEMAKGLCSMKEGTPDCRSKALYYSEFPRSRTNRKYRERERDGCKELAHAIAEAKSLDRQGAWASGRPRGDGGAAA